MSEVIKKHAFKIQVGSAISIILFVASSVWWTASVKAEYEQRFTTLANQYEHCHKWYEGLQEVQDDLVEDNQDQEIIITEIRTKLTNIEAMLVDIKKGL